MVKPWLLHKPVENWHDNHSRYNRKKGYTVHLLIMHNAGARFSLCIMRSYARSDLSHKCDM